MREISVWNADGQDTSSAMFITEGENIQRTAKNVIQGGNLSPDPVCTNKNLLALLKASSAEKSLSHCLSEKRSALWLVWIHILLLASKRH